MNTTKVSKSIFARALAIILCFLMCFTFIPWLDNESATADAADKIKIGDYVQMGTYYGESILWRCVAFYKVDENGNVDLDDTKDQYEEGYLPLMLSDKILCLKAFDASGDMKNGSHGRGFAVNNIKGKNRQIAGSNCWEDSNMRCWLNSTAIEGAVEWTCGNPPDSTHLASQNNAYDEEAGFLSNFTPNEISCMKKVSQYQILDQFEYDIMSGKDITGYKVFDIVDNNNLVKDFNKSFRKTITDTMFLIDVKQVTEVRRHSVADELGANYYIGKPTAKCVENNGTGIDDLSVDNFWKYWLRTPCASGNQSEKTRYVSSTGSVTSAGAYASPYGVRPAFYLNLSSADIESGEGTETSPYVVSAVDFTAPTAVANLVYTGSDQALVTGGSATNGTIKYALGSDATTAPTAAEDWCTDVPTGNAEGPYYVWYKVEGAANYNDVEPACVPVTIGNSDNGLDFIKTGIKTLLGLKVVQALIQPKTVVVAGSSLSSFISIYKLLRTIVK